MSSRTYLSIGDVLTLLREEFPDVTISKIRFLESQGLVNPERSPSGYRKFFEADVERLRWVLRQQREHFLPLKVIRDRLADGDLSEGGAEEPVAAASAASATSAASPVNGKTPARAHAVAGAGLSGRSRAGGLGTTTTAARTEEQSTQADDEAMARILADASRRVARVPESARHAPLPAVPDPGAPHSAGHTDVLNVPREHDAAVVAATATAPVNEGLRADPDAPRAAVTGATPGGASTGGASPGSQVAGGGAHEQQASPRGVQRAHRAECANRATAPVEGSPAAVAAESVATESVAVEPVAVGPISGTPASVSAASTAPHAAGGSGATGQAAVGARGAATAAGSSAQRAPGRGSGEGGAGGETGAGADRGADNRCRRRERGGPRRRRTCGRSGKAVGQWRRDQRRESGDRRVRGPGRRADG